MSRKSALSSTEDLTKLSEDLKTNLPLHEKINHNLRQYRNVFTGSELIEFLMKKGYLDMREDAIKCAASMYEKGLFEHAAVFSQKKVFEEGYVFYKWPSASGQVSLTMRNLKEFLPKNKSTASVPQDNEPDLSTLPAIKTGFLAKKGELNPKFKKRWILLSTDEILYYFEKQGDRKPKGSIDLKSNKFNVERFSSIDHPFAFTMYAEGAKRVWTFEAERLEDVKSWISVLNDVVSKVDEQRPERNEKSFIMKKPEPEKEKEENLNAKMSMEEITEFKKKQIEAYEKQQEEEKKNLVKYKEEERKREEEERKKEEEDHKRMEEQRKKDEEDHKRMEEQRKKDEEERKRMEELRKKETEEILRKSPSSIPSRAPSPNSISPKSPRPPTGPPPTSQPNIFRGGTPRPPTSFGPKPPAGPKPPQGQSPRAQLTNSANNNSSIITQQKTRSPISENEVPVIVGQTINWLNRKGITTDGLFRESAPATEMKDLKLKYDRNQPVSLESVQNPHLVAGLLKLYFRERQNPIFSPTALKMLKEGFTMPESDPERLSVLRNVIQTMPDSDQKTIVFLFNFLVRVANHSQQNQMTPSNLGICWGPTLFRTGAQAAPLVQHLIDEFFQIMVVLDL